MAASSGHILNVQALCRQAGLGYETTRRYIEVLEDTLIMFRVPAWSGSSRSSAVRTSPTLPSSTSVCGTPFYGGRSTHRFRTNAESLLEYFVACELHRRLRTLWPEAALFHYRTRSGAEVDFVLEVGRDLWGIEVKAARRVSRSMLRGLASLAARSDRVKRRIVVYTGDRRQLLDGVDVVPLMEFLTELPG